MGSSPWVPHAGERRLEWKVERGPLTSSEEDILNQGALLFHGDRLSACVGVPASSA